MHEQWMKWEPIKGLSRKYDVDFILDGKEGGLIIRLYDDKGKSKKIDMIFKNYAISYRHANESFRIKVIYDLEKKYGKDFYGDWTFFKVLNSEYLHWLSEESCHIYEGISFTHFCILGADSIVDVIASYEPLVQFVEEK